TTVLFLTIVIVGANFRPALAQPPSKDLTPQEQASPKKQAIEDLKTILSKTESSDTFLITFQVLAQHSPNDITLLPLAIRNAERLGLTMGLLSSNQRKPEQQAFLQTLAQLDPANRNGPTNPPACAPIIECVPSPSSSRFEVPR